eukprot:816842-Amphidinium_carterae.1
MPSLKSNVAQRLAIHHSVEAAFATSATPRGNIDNRAVVDLCWSSCAASGTRKGRGVDALAAIQLATLEVLERLATNGEKRVPQTLEEYLWESTGGGASRADGEKPTAAGTKGLKNFSCPRNAPQARQVHERDIREANRYGNLRMEVERWLLTTRAETRKEEKKRPEDPQRVLDQHEAETTHASLEEMHATQRLQSELQMATARAQHITNGRRNSAFTMVLPKPLVEASLGFAPVGQMSPQNVLRGSNGDVSCTNCIAAMLSTNTSQQ